MRKMKQNKLWHDLNSMEISGEIRSNFLFVLYACMMLYKKK